MEFWCTDDKTKDGNNDGLEDFTSDGSADKPVDEKYSGFTYLGADPVNGRRILYRNVYLWTAEGYSKASCRDYVYIQINPGIRKIHLKLMGVEGRAFSCAQK